VSKNAENTLGEETVSMIDDRRRFYAERLRTEIPANWDIQNIGDLCSIKTGKLDVNQADEGGKYPFFTCAEKIYRINTHAFDAEAVLVAGNGFFNVKYYKGKFNAYQRTYVLADIKTDAKFLYYYIDYRLRDITGQSRGSTISYIRLGDLRDYPVAVAPPDQQKCIVAEIEKQFSRLDEAVANLKRVKANLKRYKAAVLKAAVEGALVPIKNRQTTKIGEVADLVTKGSSPNWQGFTYTDSGVVFVRSQNVGWGSLDLSDVAHLSPAFNEKERKSVLRTGDVLLNIVGASIGRAAVATPEIEGGNVNQAVAVIRLNPERMLPKYLMLNLLSPGTQATIHAEKVDVARANVSLSDIKDFSVLFPSLAEQGTMIAEVERRLSVIEALESVVQTNLTRADRLRQSILSQAFNGKLLSNGVRG
jgi:restriction endonuclease S subunit